MQEILHSCGHQKRRVVALTERKSGAYAAGMKSIAVILLLTLTCHAQNISKQQTIRTRDNQIFENVIITSTTGNSITVSSDSGIAHISKEALPNDLQKKIGYVPFAESEKAKKLAVENEKKKSDLKVYMREMKQGLSDIKRNNALKELPTPTQYEAEELSGMPVNEFIEKYGHPQRIIPGTDADGINYSILTWVNNTGKDTVLTVINEKIFNGSFKGVDFEDQSRKQKSEDHETVARYFHSLLDK